MKKLVISVLTEDASEAERGVVFRHIEKLGGMGGFAEKKHDANVMGIADIITWSDGGVMQSSPVPKELTITVSGPTGSGKTILANYIQSALNARGIATGGPVQSNYSDKIIIGGGQFMDIRSLAKPRVETVQAVEVKVSAGEAMAAIDKVDLALAALSLPADNINSELYDAANSVLLGLLRDEPKIDATSDAGQAAFVSGVDRG